MHLNTVMQGRIAEVLKKYSFHFPPIKRRYDKEHGGDHNKQNKQVTDQPTNTFIKPTNQTKQSHVLSHYSSVLNMSCLTLTLTLQFQSMTERLSKFRVRC